ncbi:hypothetical protein Pse7367_1892 [Thalassoporum mexicanum PCC 7367]|uniref:NB-ARC domain-containing protein n=1 Tax=Thalassoporum mexicanum TaxID=3457544 RepID=UPI00029FE5FA|nr:NB-ARC domain-containing protein [Pseudanabaena sp. PCC 7367]AFY70168.1 hypothetical protein Pse7367_1892 [Pseudanabaena sp. PCC 7367]
MTSSPDEYDNLFPEAQQNWDLDRLYADIEAINTKPLRSVEKACLRGLLCRFRPGQIAFKLNWTSGTLRVDLNKGLYRYIEALAEQPLNTLRWDKVSEWIEARGYKVRMVVPAESSNGCGTTDWGEAPEVPLFFGRSQELSDLASWITIDRTRLLAIWGMGGIGKTALTVKLIEKVQGEFEYLIWRSLRDVQPIGQILADWFQFLTNSQETRLDLPYLMEVLKAKRCLIVLDDFETVMQDGELVGLYRQGCEEYGELLQRLGKERHQSCLVLLSREQPKEVAMLEGEGQFTRSFHLGGLQRKGAMKLLQARGFSGKENGLDALNGQYRGNPAALRIVSSTIQELFDGNVSDFLKQTQLALGDILRNLLYEQFDRLSELETDVVYWLAIKRRPVSLNELRESMEETSSGSELLDAIESLRWRSLIEKLVEKNSAKREVLFLLEPVVLKYVSKRFIEEVGREVKAIVTNRNFNHILLLRSHVLVEDSAPENIRAAQIRLMLKPIKDKLTRSLSKAGIAVDELTEQLAIAKQEQSTTLDDYADSNLSLLGLLI